MITMQTIVSQIEIKKPEGILFVEFKKQILNDGVVISEGFHRTSCAPGTDLDMVLKTNNDDLVNNFKVGPIVPEHWDDVVAHTKLAWTPEVLANWEKSANSNR